MIEYKGYVARVEFESTADAFHGRVVNTGAYPLVTFETSRAGALRREFERAVDSYLALCAERGITPRKPASGTLNVRLGSNLHAAVAAAAADSGTSINAWIVDTLKRRVFGGGDTGE